MLFLMPPTNQSLHGLVGGEGTGFMQFCARYCSRLWRYSSEQKLKKKKKFPAVMELTSYTDSLKGRKEGRKKEKKV